MCINVCTYVTFFLRAKTTLLVDINYFTAIKVINFLIVVTNEKRADSSKEDCEMFSKAGQVVSDRRCALKPHIVNALLFINQNYDLLNT